MSRCEGDVRERNDMVVASLPVLGKSQAPTSPRATVHGQTICHVSLLIAHLQAVRLLDIVQHHDWFPKLLLRSSVHPSGARDLLVGSNPVLIWS